MSQRFAEVDDFNKPKAKKRRSSKRKKKRYEFNETEVSSNSKFLNPKAETTKVTNPKAETTKVTNPKAETTKATNPKVETTKVTNSKVETTEAINPKVEKGNKDELSGHKIIVLQDQVKHFEKLIIEKNKMIKGLKEKNKEIQTENNDVLQMGIQLKHELISQVNAREEELKQFVQLQSLHTNIEKEHEKLARQYKALERKYQGLSGSKLGRLTLRYWEFMNRFRRGQK
ncbi:hypothetical protein [Bacillus cereus]|uniref:hypothetical protein n=1 Tax=Bacillus cereus TaxID=1396 RepID=UPI003D662C39